MKPAILSMLFASTLGACAYGVGEKFFFRPQPAAKLATDPAEMRIDDEERITGPFADAHFLDGRPSGLVGRLPAKLTHDLKSFGGGRTAITLAKAANGNDGEPLIVFCGGSSWSRINRGSAYLDRLLPWGEVLMFDYPGYGDSTGAPWATSFDAVFSDMAPWLDEVTKDRPLVFWGHSIGGLVCSRLARASHEVDALVLETTATNATRIAKDKTWAIPGLIVEAKGDWSTFDIPVMLDGFKGPVLVIGAGKDGTLPVPLARGLAKALETKGLHISYREYPNAGHLDASNQPGFAEDAAAFFRTVTDLRR